MRRARLVLYCTLVLAVALGAAGAAGAEVLDPGGRPSKELRRAVTVENILKHERNLQAIARRHGNTRASGTGGYTGSASYVAGRLRNAGYEVTVQHFRFPFFEETRATRLERVSPDPETYRPEADFHVMTYSGSGNVTADIQPVDITLPPAPEEDSSTSGCERADFAGFVRGNIALIQRGKCPFAQKAENAENAGASAVLIFNEGQPGRREALGGTLDGPVVDIPVVGTSFAVGQELARLDRSGDVRVRVFTSTRSGERGSSNIIADTPRGDPNNTVVVGAHLDSVPEGPGINDNGSGTATVLETAVQMARLNIKPENRVRFAFWGAEEFGLHGSTHYVESLSRAQLDKIALNLNFDMVGSPNFVRFVYDGDGSNGPKGPPGSGNIEKVFNDYFTSQNLRTEPTAFNGRSDYKPFIDAKIPAGGLFSGAEDIKTEREARIYGGKAGVPYDPCYHKACDNLSNLNYRALNQLSDAAAHATVVFAVSGAPPVESRSAEASEDDAAPEMEYAGPDAVR